MLQIATFFIVGERCGIVAADGVDVGVGLSVFQIVEADGVAVAIVFHRGEFPKPATAVARIRIDVDRHALLGHG